VLTTDPKATDDALLVDPHYYLFDTIPERGETRFLVTNERELAAATFADIRFEKSATGDVKVNTQALTELVHGTPIARPQIGFVFHHAFVCSTLLARSLNEIPAFFSLKEPWILRRLADIKRQHAGTIPAEHWKLIVSAYVDLLAKQYKSGESLVLKATNVANNLLWDVFWLWPERPVLYMHSDVRAFLITNLKKNRETRQKMPMLLRDFIKDSDIQSRWGAIEIPPNRSLLQTCALIWVANIYALRCAAERYEPARLRCLDMHTFLEHPKAAMRAVSRHFGHEPNDHDMLRMTSKDIMGRNAKDQSLRFDRVAKAGEDQRVLDARRDEIDSVVAWIDPLVRELGLYEFLQDRTLSLQN
jgi:hypothetical protein